MAPGIQAITDYTLPIAVHYRGSTFNGFQRTLSLVGTKRNFHWNRLCRMDRNWSRRDLFDRDCLLWRFNRDDASFIVCVHRDRPHRTEAARMNDITQQGDNADDTHRLYPALDTIDLRINAVIITEY